MKQQRRFVSLAVAILTPLLFGSHVLAASPQITEQIVVTAIVPSHRDIILDNAGDIVSVYSNTTDDVSPSVYTGNVAPENQKDLTPVLLAQYRQLVPEGTAKYGVLYERSPANAVLSRITTHTTSVATPENSVIASSSWSASPRS